MSIRFSRAAVVSVIGFCSSLPILFASQPASAALGGAPMTPPAGASTSSTTVTAPATSGAASGATSNATAVMRSASSSAAASSGSYTVRTTEIGNGNVVREYISASGDVFGLAWSGPQMPDLNNLLGSYFPQYVAGVANAHKLRGRGPGIVQDSGLVVYSGGHMGAFSGQAYLPQALPAGVSAADIQ
jgi:hypothetical protein